MYDNKKVIEDNNLIYIDDISLGDGYRWVEIEVYYSKEENRYFWISGSGCSCDSLWENVNTIADMCNGSRQNAADAIRAFAEENTNGYYSGNEAIVTSKIWEK